jgi:hypothetical protein
MDGSGLLGLSSSVTRPPRWALNTRLKPVTVGFGRIIPLPPSVSAFLRCERLPGPCRSREPTLPYGHPLIRIPLTVGGSRTNDPCLGVPVPYSSFLRQSAGYGSGHLNSKGYIAEAETVLTYNRVHLIL